MQRTLKNRTIFCRDNLEVLRGMNNNTIDLIYLDPPFNKKKQFTSPIGSSAEGASFKDYWGLADIKSAWIEILKEKHPKIANFLATTDAIGHKSNKYYLTYLAVRLIEMHRVLKPTGSIYLHCDQTMSHYLKLLMDCVFGHRNLRNEIVWCYKGASEAKKSFPNKHDIILFYSKSDEITFNFDAIRLPYKDDNKNAAKWKDGEHEKHPLGTKCLDWFDDIPSFMTASQSKERVGYPTQKPLALMERIIKASTNEGDLVLDPFCGCATTCVAAERLKRKWIGIDVSEKAYDLVQERLTKEVQWGNLPMYKGKVAFSDRHLIFREDIPERTDIETKPLRGKYKQEVKKKLYGEQGGYCGICDKHFEIIHLEIDHIYPKSKGGGDHLSNLMLLCGHCNKRKADKEPAEAKSIIRTP